MRYGGLGPFFLLLSMLTFRKGIYYSLDRKYSYSVQIGELNYEWQRAAKLVGGISASSTHNFVNIAPYRNPNKPLETWNPPLQKSLRSDLFKPLSSHWKTRKTAKLTEIFISLRIGFPLLTSIISLILPLIEIQTHHWKAETLLFK